jgi:hypothetical protein
MLLKLLVPHYNRSIPGGRILRWHKAEGDWVDYGEDLIDLQIDEVRLTQTIKKGTVTEWHEKLLQMLGEQASGASSPEALPLLNGTDPPESTYRHMMATAYMRVCASDAGFLHKICAQVGDLRKVGEVMAILTTEEHESVEECERALNEASVFRAVANFIRLDEGD